MEVLKHEVKLPYAIGTRRACLYLSQFYIPWPTILNAVKPAVHGETLVSQIMKDFIVSQFYRVRTHEILLETQFHETKILVSP